MRELLFIICLIGVITVKSFAQYDASAHKLLDLGTEMEDKMMKLSAPITKSRNHNLYLNASWQNSAVVNEDDEVIYFNGRYNVLDKAIELKNKNGIRSIRADRVKAAMIGKRYFIVVPQEFIEGVANTSFFELLSLGKTNLYVQHILKSRMIGSNSLTTSLNGDKEYYIDQELYYHKTGQSCKKLKSNKKNVLTLMEDGRIEVETFRKENNLKYKSQKDLIRIFDFYNSLED